ncbi:hypothetical protein [Streptomyces beigongshangae]|uniref:hypothetical protein n=1 Tax=Streptomyces beigongshangae TaxID=2841597 RepID=UPI001C8418BE|nr:hypothetical protein [Streptomyces sp. REN17]
MTSESTPSQAEGARDDEAGNPPADEGNDRPEIIQTTPSQAEGDRDDGTDE